mmetsp:Transcript_26619/g.87271  ORF Transcript_26619/g.87271 Transcript_26619/m.87271 type:complete len:221 (-) Transcript_26619:110-772(-)|eukprot:CAMPEP_0170136296 /NCGR_PEP_ID=MMETSP0033_2-20121228/3170_1 /TAXON_ID=195969 /ORGANISM="Dolichomastix tenuilepis, Strain CCMP3274" /LENGTH=220 /DNA_ID=CAMNT_0010371993 /DNA_START=14 /DNA_END=676 /DNA_ORIENTATION=-
MASHALSSTCSSLGASRLSQRAIARPSRLAAHRRAGIAAASGAGEEETIFDKMERGMKAMRANTPVLGLLARLTTAEGGVAERLGYSEFCRAKAEASPPEFRLACTDLVERNGQGRERDVMCVVWMLATGAGLMDDEDILVAARRLRVRGVDMEFEMYRFEEKRDAGMAQFRKRGLKYTPPANLPELAQEALKRVAVGDLPDEDLTPEDAKDIATLVSNL